LRRKLRFKNTDLVIMKKSVKGLSRAALTRFLAKVRRALGLPGAISVLVTSSREMQGLNRRFRGKNNATDVLSFPAMPGVTEKVAGDVAISVEIAERNAHRLGHAAADEIRILALHGVLHLAGYDHERDDGEMERKEQHLRKSLGLPAALIERSGTSAGKDGSASKRRRARTDAFTLGKPSRTSRKRVSR
jgi:probable rRNA maturation factor